MPENSHQLPDVVIADAGWLIAGSDRTQRFSAGATVWYFGDDYRLYRAIRDSASTTAIWGGTGRRLNEILEKHAVDFINLGDGVSISDLEWWETRNIAERGPLSSSIVVECCRAILFLECLAEGGQHLFVTEAPDLAKALLELGRRQGIRSIWRGPSRVEVYIRGLARQARKAAGFARAVLRRIARIRRLKSLRNRNPIPFDRLSACDILLAAWTEAGDFQTDQPRISAHYMGTVPGLLREQGHSVGYIALPLDWLGDIDTIYKEAICAADPLILTDDAVTPLAVLRAAISSLTQPVAATEGFSIGGHILTPIANLVLSRERFDWRAVDARALSCIGPFLARHDCRPKTIMHVYENQTWEKGLRSGLRRALPATLIAGIHQSPFSKMYLNMLPSSHELSSGSWPDYVFTHGAHCARLLSQTGAGNRVINAGLFRPGGFGRDRFSGNMDCGGSRTLLCATGIDFQESCELVAKSTEAVARRPEWRLLINFHPATSATFRDGIRELINKSGIEAQNLSFADESISRLLDKQVAAVLYTDTNAAFEGVAAGARAINIERDNALSFDKLPDGLSRRVCNVEELTDLLDRIGNADGWPSGPEAGRVLADCFSPPNLGAITEVLGLAQGQRSEHQATGAAVRRVAGT